MKAEVVAIYIGPTEGMKLPSVQQVNAVAGKGIEGDRNFMDGNDADRQITLIEQEALDALARDVKIELGPGESRRNVVTRGVALNHLVGKQFYVGAVTLKGHRLCEPCTHLEKLTKEGVRMGLLHRGGLRAEIVKGGTIRVGDAISAG